MPTAFYVSYAVLWVLVLFMAVLLLLVYRHFGVIAMGTYEGVQRDGLLLGEEVPPLSGVTPAGEDTTLLAPQGRPRFLLFAHPDCGPCGVVMPAVNHLAASAREAGLDVVGIVAGPREEVVRLSEKYEPPFPVLAEDGSGAFQNYRVRVTPFAFVIGADGRVQAKGLCNDPTRVRDLLASGGMEDAARVLEEGLPVELPLVKA